ncbi:MAG TPA: cadmium-translocating P-type ATPase [Candidatus Eubacterium faecigallinarum]|nr:cadmium-translocating P-type ATPase [Candidatus Eubacterium faecigallinarum]
MKNEHNHDECEIHEHGDGCGCGHDHAHEELNKKDFIFKVVVGGVLLVAGYILNELAERGIADIPSFVYLICFIISYLIVGFSILREAVEGIMHKDIFNENFLMGIASIGAFAVGEYVEGCAVMFLFTIGEFLQSLAVQRSRKSIKDMLELKPQEVKVLRDGREITLSPEDVKIGDIMVIRPGEKLDIDGRIVEGCAELDMKALTGESIPVSKAPGDEVLAGSVNVDGAIKVEATKEYKDSTVSKILDMLEKAEDKKSNAEHFITRFARIYTPIVCLLALAVILVPPLFFGGEWKDWIFRGLSVLVVSCPCALVISIPLSFFSGIGACSKEGILVKGSNYLEMLAKADTGVFDKTGTITSGKFEYVKCECHNCHCSDNQHRELLGIIAACEKYSNHPLAKSISLAFGHYADGKQISDAKNYPGKGVSAVVDGVRYYVGNDKLMKEIGIEFEETKCIGTAVYCASETEFKGDIVFADIIKQDSKEAIADLHKMGITHTVMLTGDKEPIAKDIAKKAGINTVYAKLLPDEKVEKVKELQESGKTVFYTGDGINDAPVLAQADLGIAMGGIGSDVAIEASDMVIMGDSLSKIPKGRKIAKKAMTIVRENIIFSLVVKLIIIIGSTLGIFEENAMWLAVFGDVGVCLIAVANSMRTMIPHKKK